MEEEINNLLIKLKKMENNYLRIECIREVKNRIYILKDLTYDQKNYYLKKLEEISNLLKLLIYCLVIYLICSYMK